MRFTVIVPVYQVENLLEQCVKSLVSQTYDNIEIILVDDGSVDSSGEICDQWAEKDHRIRVFHKKNGGLSDARNYGLSKATGEYILFVDSDDYIEQKCFEVFNKHIGNNEFDMVVGNAIVQEKGKDDFIIMRKVIETDSAIYSGKDFLLDRLSSHDISMTAWMYLYRREFLEKNNLMFKYGIYHEDQQFTPRALIAARTVSICDYPFYHYVIRHNSITTSANYRRKANDIVETVNELSNLYVNIHEKNLKKYLYDYLCTLYLSAFYTGDLLSDPNHIPQRVNMIKYAYSMKNRIKALVFFVSPTIYYRLNQWLKKEGRYNDK